MGSSTDAGEDHTEDGLGAAILLYVVMIHLGYFLFYLVVLWFFPAGWIAAGVVLLLVVPLVVMADRRSLFAVLALTLVVALETATLFGHAYSSLGDDWNGLDTIVAGYAMLTTVATVGLIGLSVIVLKERMLRSRPGKGPRL